MHEDSRQRTARIGEHAGLELLEALLVHGIPPALRADVPGPIPSEPQPASPRQSGHCHDYAATALSRLKYRGDLPPAVDPAQLDLPAGHETEEQDDRGFFAWQRALRLHTAAKLFVKTFDHVRRPERLPLPLGKSEEREELVAALAEARHESGRRLSKRRPGGQA